AGHPARQLPRGSVMPNPRPAVTHVPDAVAYRERILAALPEGADFDPLMTCYLTETTDPDDLEPGFADGVFTAAKYYPAGATTNSASGVTDLINIRRVLER